MKVDTHLNILISYAYMKGKSQLSDRVCQLVREKRMNLMIDLFFSLATFNATLASAKSFSMS